MKKFFILAMFAIALGGITSCASYGQVVTDSNGVVYAEGVVYDGITYYDYYMDDYYYNGVPVIYVDNLWYYQYWDAARMLWYRRPVPREYWGGFYRPRYHDRGLGGHWVGSYPRPGGFRNGHGPVMRGDRGPGMNRGGNLGGSRSGVGTQPRGNQGGSRSGVGTQPRGNQGGSRSNMTSSPSRSNSGSRGTMSSPSRSSSSRGNMSGGSRSGGMSGGGSRGGGSHGSGRGGR